MRKAFAFIVLFQLTGLLSKAQLTLQPLVPQTGVFQKAQLWSVLVANSSSNTLSGYLVLSLEDRESGVEILSATTNTFLLNKGAKQLNNASLTPIQYSYVSDQASDFLPVGSYTACYKLMGAGHNAGVLAEACVPFDVAPLSPPMLISPADSAVLPSTPAQFSWQPPAPLTMFSQLHYEVVIAEIQPGQTPDEAVELNAPLYMDLNVPYSFLNYTGTYPTFEKGKWYAWQVVAQDGQSYAAKTPAWNFMIDSTIAPKVVPVNGNYILLKSSKEPSSGVNMLETKALGIKYYCYDRAHTTTMNFKDAGGNVIKQVQENLDYGENFIGYELDKIFKKGNVYSVEITDIKNNKSIAFFEIQ